MSGVPLSTKNVTFISLRFGTYVLTNGSVDRGNRSGGLCGKFPDSDTQYSALNGELFCFIAVMALSGLKRKRGPSVPSARPPKVRFLRLQCISCAYAAEAPS